MATEKTFFQTLHEMAENDDKNKTATAGVCNHFIGGQKTKQGGHITMGVPADVFMDILADKKRPFLLVLDMNDYNKIKEIPLEDDWIKVEDRSPELTEPQMWYNDESREREVLYENNHAMVWAFSPELGQFKAKLDRRGWSEISSISIRGIHPPTHWRPLFNNPK